MGRRAVIVVIGVFGVAAWLAIVLGVVVVGLVGANVVHNRAMDRCTHTPPGFPRELSRAGTGITVEWKLFPFRYDCVYAAPGVGIVKRSPPSG